MQGGFGSRGVWANLVEWINKLDIEKTKARAGMEEGAEQPAQ